GGGCARLGRGRGLPRTGAQRGRGTGQAPARADADRRFAGVRALQSLPSRHGAPHGQERMSIKSDRWIRRMAEGHGMIEPFEPGQVKFAGKDGQGERIVSYGTSSYGYDVRCSREFKVFTNINSTIVDPKAFDPASFVDIESDVCIIPPNSFALARTVEYFRIPRDT